MTVTLQLRNGASLPFFGLADAEVQALADQAAALGLPLERWIALVVKATATRDEEREGPGLPAPEAPALRLDLDRGTVDTLTRILEACPAYGSVGELAQCLLQDLAQGDYQDLALVHASEGPAAVLEAMIGRYEDLLEVEVTRPVPQCWEVG